LKDFLLVIGSGIDVWGKRLGLGVLEEKLVPFDDVEHVQKMVKTFMLALRSMHLLDRMKPLRVNVVCGSDIGECLKAVDYLARLGEVVIIVPIERVDSAESHELIRSICKVKNVVLLIDSFEQFYGRKHVIKVLNSRTRVTVAFDLDLVLEDLDLVYTLQKRLNLYGLYISRGFLADCIAFGSLKLFMDTMCTVHWISLEVVPLHEEFGGGKRASKSFLALPIENSRATLVLAPSGVYLFEGERIEPLQLDAISRVLGSNAEDALLTLRWIKPSIVFRVRDSFVISEDDVRLLRCIDEYKCLRKAMKCMGMNYLSLRKRVEELERALGTKLVISKRGGSEKGFTELTPMGKKILEMLETLIASMKRVLDENLGQPLSKDICAFMDFP